MPTITPFLWFENKAEEAMDFYTSVFKDSTVGTIKRYSDEVPGPAGKVITASFTLCGQEFMILNGGPNGDQSKFTGAISFFVNVETQDEIDYYWEALTVDGGQPGRCGWLKDQFGLSWQIVPNMLSEVLSNPDPLKAQKAMQAMLQMSKLNISELEQVATT